MDGMDVWAILSASSRAVNLPPGRLGGDGMEFQIQLLIAPS